jgi:hypothetical protein
MHSIITGAWLKPMLHVLVASIDYSKKQTMYLSFLLKFNPPPPHQFNKNKWKVQVCYDKR